MEKKKGKIKEVNEKYDIMLEGENEWLTPVERVKQYVNESIIGSEVDLVMQNDKITFLKVLDGETPQNGKGGDSDKVLGVLEHINWNMGSISKYLKLTLLNQLETTKSNQEGLTKIQQAMLKELKNGLEKDLKQLEQIKEEQEK